MKNCASCEVVGEKSVAVTTRNGEPVCLDCAADIDSREAEAKQVREQVYDDRGIRR